MELYYQFVVPRSKRVQKYFIKADYLIITLTKGQTTLVSLEDFHLVKDKIIKVQYDKTIEGYYSHIKTDKGYKCLHNYLATGYNGSVDHKNRFHTLDNRKSNIRLATAKQQTFNQRRSTRGREIYDIVLRGVTRRKDSGTYRWRAQKLDNSQTGIGGYLDEITAAKAWDNFMYEEYKNDHPMKGLCFNGICSEPTINFIMFNYPEDLPLTTNTKTL